MAASNGFDAYQHESGGRFSVEKFELLRVRSRTIVPHTTAKLLSLLRTSFACLV
jgi:hypothetical protein